jgi:hypothetical protein
VKARKSISLSAFRSLLWVAAVCAAALPMVQVRASSLLCSSGLPCSRGFLCCCAAVDLGVAVCRAGLLCAGLPGCCSACRAVLPSCCGLCRAAVLGGCCGWGGALTPHPHPQAHALMGTAFYVTALFLLDGYRVVTGAWGPAAKVVAGGQTSTATRAAAGNAVGALLSWVVAGVILVVGASAHAPGERVALGSARACVRACVCVFACARACVCWHARTCVSTSCVALRPRLPYLGRESLCVHARLCTLGRLRAPTLVYPCLCDLCAHVHTPSTPPPHRVPLVV